MNAPAPGRGLRAPRVAVAGGLAILAAALAIGLRPSSPPDPSRDDASAVADVVFEGKASRWTFAPEAGTIHGASRDAKTATDIALSLVVDGGERALLIPPGALRRTERDALVATFPITVGDDRAEGNLGVGFDPSSERVLVRLWVQPLAGSGRHTYALRAGTSPEERAVFVPGVGKASDEGERRGRAAVLDDDVHPVALFSPRAELGIVTVGPDLESANREPRLVVTTDEESFEQSLEPTPTRKELELGLLLAPSSAEAWGLLFRQLGMEVARVTGTVTGTDERAHVHARGDDGKPYARAVVGADGRFTLEVPKNAELWHATVQSTEASPPVRFPPGTPWDLALDVAPGGELHVRVIDADTGKPLLARLMIKGVEGSSDPNFGPDYRASGAGPLMDLLQGEVRTPLPRGRYRVSATHGLEWSIDAVPIEVRSGHTEDVELALRHVVPTPGLVGCDLHVHARPSFDSPVTVEDRVLSLAAAGIDFAVPTEHNMVGDYAPATELLDLGKRFASVTGVEVTTYGPRFGHFGVFPWPAGRAVPPFKGTSAQAIFAAGHRGDPTRVVQVHHPRLGMGIGWFGIVGFDPRSGKIPAGMATDFDTLEVYNGYEAAHRDRVERVMDDWFALLNLGKRVAATGSSDSHRIQYQWAGYPRTFVMLDAREAGDGGLPVDTREVVAAIKAGRSIVTSGPLIDLELGRDAARARPGDTLRARTAPLAGRLRVRAAPWIDVETVDIVAGIGIPTRAGDPDGGLPSASDPARPGRTVVLRHLVVPTRPTTTGREAGSLDEATARAVRLETELSLDVPPDATWVVAVARGERRMDDALPFMQIQPMGFTNPIWLGD